MKILIKVRDIIKLNSRTGRTYQTYGVFKDLLLNIRTSVLHDRTFIHYMLALELM